MTREEIVSLRAEIWKVRNQLDDLDDGLEALNWLLVEQEALLRGVSWSKP